MSPGVASTMGEVKRGYDHLGDSPHFIAIYPRFISSFNTVAKIMGRFSCGQKKSRQVYQTVPG